jgi:cation diffusion facilitator CzcD-associated flavoprotein CzcO
MENNLAGPSTTLQRLPTPRSIQRPSLLHPSLQNKQTNKPPQTVLLIGAGVSSTDIAREITPFAKTVYQSSRNGPDDIPAAFQPPFTIRVGELASFSPPSSPSSAPGSARITLKDGRVLTGIDSVVFCTGYITTYPFLADLHTDFTAPEDADDTVLVTDGNMVHNLHNDIFYIPDPSLAFVGVPYYVATFSLFEFQSIAVAAVFAGRAWLPSQSEMRAEYQARVKEKGLGRGLHSLKNAEVGYVSELVGWLNEHAKTTGAERVEGHSEAWIAEDEKKFEKLIRHFGVPGPQVEAVMKKFLSGRGGKEKRAVEEIAAA